MTLLSFSNKYAKISEERIMFHSLGIRLPKSPTFTDTKLTMHRTLTAPPVGSRSTGGCSHVACLSPWEKVRPPGAPPASLPDLVLG